VTVTGRFLFCLILVGGMVALAPAAWAGPWLMAAGLAAVVGLAVADALVSPGAASVVVERAYAPRCALGEPSTVALTIRNRTNVGLTVIVADEPPASFTGVRPLVRVYVQARGVTERTYRCVPARRGAYEFGRLGIGVVGVLGFIERHRWGEPGATVRVYPDTSQLRWAELARMKASSRLGAQQQARPARESGEFESLRDYVPDDDFRWIDWKASARANKPISRNFRPERNQVVYLVIDCGRLMITNIGPYTKLDYALKAALTVGYVALRQQDRVGLLAFAGDVVTDVPAGHSPRQFGRLLEVMCSLEATLTEPNYEAAFLAVRRRSARRALVVVFTDVLNVDRAEALRRCTAALVPRHLPLIVTIQDQDLKASADQRVRTEAELYEKGVASELMRERQGVLRGLQQRGALVIDASAGGLSAQVVNTYLEVKSRHRL
jgi:uncharacterized protein (DUF58 family)